MKGKTQKCLNIRGDIFVRSVIVHVFVPNGNGTDVTVRFMQSDYKNSQRPF